MRPSSSLISVIIPLYKSERYISETLDSVLSQTYTHFEILCVDDCSPDSTVELVTTYTQRDPRVRLIRHTENKGAPAFGRNSGLAVAKGEFVAFLDHDDLWEPRKLEKQLAFMDHEKVDFCCCNIYLLHAVTGKKDMQAWGTITGNPRPAFAARLLQGNFVPPASTLIRRSVFETTGGFDTSLRGVDDYDMWYRIARLFPASLLQEPLASWRYRNQASISADDSLMIRDQMAFYHKMCTDPLFNATEQATAALRITVLKRMLANRALLAGRYSEAVTLYEATGTSTAARATRRLPQLTRLVYRLKRRLQPEFQPLNLVF